MAKYSRGYVILLLPRMFLGSCFAAGQCGVLLLVVFSSMGWISTALLRDVGLVVGLTPPKLLNSDIGPLQRRVKASEVVSVASSRAHNMS